MAAPALSAVGEMARADEARFRAAFFAEESAREALFGLIALDLELARISGSVSEPMLGDIRLEWWRGALLDVVAGKTGGTHPAIEALEGAAVDRDRAEALVGARRFELAGEPPDEAGLAGYLDGLAEWQALSVGVLGGDEQAKRVAAQIGRAEATARFLMLLPMFAARGFAPLAEAEDRRLLLDGKTPEVVKGLAENALADLAKARGERAQVAWRLRAPLLSIRSVEPLLRAAAGGEFDLFQNAWRPSPVRAQMTFLFAAMSGRY